MSFLCNKLIQWQLTSTHNSSHAVYTSNLIDRVCIYIYILTSSSIGPSIFNTIMDFLFTAFPPAVISLAVVILLASIFWPKKNKRYPPVVGTVLHQLSHRRTLHHYHTELASKYKTYRILDLFKYAVYTADPANVEHILKTNFGNYGKVRTYKYGILYIIK